MSFAAIASRGIIYSGGVQVAKLIISFSSAIMTARILAPADFGIVALAMPLFVICQVLQSAGISQSLIQRQTVTDTQRGGIFVASIVLSALVAIGLLASMRVYTDYVHHAELQSLVDILSAGLLLGAIANQAAASLLREMRFRLMAARDLVSAVASATIMILTAYFTRDYRSLVVPLLVDPIVTIFVASFATRWFPRKVALDAGLKEMISFGMSVTIHNVANAIARNADKWIIAKYEGIFQLGLYDRAYRLLLLPVTEVVNPVGRVLIPVLARCGEDGHQFRRLFGVTLTILLAAIQPPVIALTVYSHVTVEVLLGSSWSGASDIFAWLGAAGVVQVATYSLGWIFVSQGAGKEYARLGLTSVPVTVSGFLIGIQWGVIGLAISYVLTELCFRLPLAIRWAGARGHFSSRDLLKLLLPHMLACLGTLLIAMSVPVDVEAGSPLFLSAAVCGCYSSYLAVLFCFAAKREVAFTLMSKVRTV
ncbi:polysaccharide transporter, PST family [Rhizobium sp. NFR07]|uniref:lipopolysaccharide biosynthesis protein n=1 Tax=Rhizobium sp. NFR07 TaxID=1566262 RepID=UPI0008E718E4|nr:lipopolysaccharide biosynthesis protein [Rhizobium sp. NFR07]SFB51075.1 polysaccharide transporter, PST family [Rhizobium sp. NFR07]